MFTKKFYRIIHKFIVFILFKLINFILIKTDFSIIPAINKVNFSNFIYSNNTRRLVFLKNNNSFNKISIDSSLSETKLCKLGNKYQTNKSKDNKETFLSVLYFTLVYKKKVSNFILQFGFSFRKYDVELSSFKFKNCVLQLGFVK